MTLYGAAKAPAVPDADGDTVEVLTDNSTGTSGGNTIAAVTDVATAANAIATLAAKVNELMAHMNDGRTS